MRGRLCGDEGLELGQREPGVGIVVGRSQRRGEERFLDAGVIEEAGFGDGMLHLRRAEGEQVK